MCERKGELAWLQIRKRMILLLFILSFFNPMGGTLVIPALPFIAKDFNLNSSESSWVFIGYEVMLIVGSVVYGKLAQAFKLRTLLYVCIVLTTIGRIYYFQLIYSYSF